MTGQHLPFKSDDLRDRNRKRLLQCVRRHEQTSRTAISQHTGLSPATVSAITSEFLDEGVLKLFNSSGSKASGRGRPKVALELSGNAALMCVVYFKLNYVSARLVDYAGQLIGEHCLEINTSGFSAHEIKATLIQSIEATLSQSAIGKGRLSRIDVGFQGVTDVEGRSVLWSPICEDRNLPVQAWLEERFKVASSVANDCDMAACALNWREPEKYGESFAALLLAHGVGMGLFLRRGIFNGTQSSGIEFGHMSYIPNGALCLCGNRGCIEAYAGNYAINRHALGLGDDHMPENLADFDQLNTVGKAARTGDLQALKAIENAGSAIGTGLASLFALLDPVPVVLVGDGAALFDLMEPSIRKAVQAAQNQNQSVPLVIDCYIDETELVLEGCAITALLKHDEVLAYRQIKHHISRNTTQ